MLLLKRLSKTLILAPKNLVTRSMNFVHHDGTGTPKQHNLYFTPQQKKILFNRKKRLIPTVQLHYNDQLIFPGYDESNILELVQQFQLKKVPLSPTNLCMLIHMFTKYHVMTQKCFDIIQKQAYRLKGEYKVRSIFGGLLGSIIYNQAKLVQFFLGQYELSNQKFTMEEITETLEALVRNNQMEKQKVKEIWNQHFRKDYLDALFTIKIRNTKALTRIFDLMIALEEEDTEIWKRIVNLMKKKHKWSRIPIIERLYSISGKYPEAEALFNAYFKKMAEEEQVIKRYNLTQLRYHTPLEIIKNIEQNPSDYSPKIRTLIPEQENAEEWNAKYQQFLTVGAVKQEEQIIKDKSKSLGFAIRERYENMQADGMDFEKMSKEQFEEMFGDFSETMKTIQFEDARIAEMQKQQEQLEAKQAEELENQQGKAKKGKGKKKGNDGEGGQKQKQKKQKSKKKQQ